MLTFLERNDTVRLRGEAAGEVGDELVRERTEGSVREEDVEGDESSQDDVREGHCPDWQSQPEARRC